MIDDGWYLMSTAQLEELLAAWRAGDDAIPEGVERLGVPEALARRDAGNLPDERDRSLRIVLKVRSEEELATIEARRAELEPDYLDPPTWRRAGSRPVNVVPLRRAGWKVKETGAWWDDPEVAALEEEWRATGAVAGVTVPGEYRSFVYKTVLALRRAGRDVTANAIADSIERWLPPAEATKIRTALVFSAESRSHTTRF